MCCSVILSPKQSPTDEEDGEGDEEQEDVGHQIESVHEAAIVQDALVHAVGIDTCFVATKRQGHAPTQSEEWIQKIKKSIISHICAVFNIMIFARLGHQQLSDLWTLDLTCLWSVTHTYTVWSMGAISGAVSSNIPASLWHFSIKWMTKLMGVSLQQVWWVSGGRLNPRSTVAESWRRPSNIDPWSTVMAPPNHDYIGQPSLFGQSSVMHLVIQCHSTDK